MKKGLVGFSWTTLFFGPWPALFRGDYGWFGVGLLVAVVSIFLAGIPALIYNIVMAFKYNKIYTKKLVIEQGFKPTDEVGSNLLKKYEIVYS